MNYLIGDYRWHADCFCCNYGGTLFDSNSNLLFYGDGSLSCNNCSDSCNACGNKIEGLIIIIGSQVYCDGCFRCSSCEKIEILRYALISQCKFCMHCYKAIKSQRREKSAWGQESKDGNQEVCSWTVLCRRLHHSRHCHHCHLMPLRAMHLKQLKVLCARHPSANDFSEPKPTLVL